MTALYFHLLLHLTLIFAARKEIIKSTDVREYTPAFTSPDMTTVPSNPQQSGTVILPHSQLPAYNAPYLRPASLNPQPLQIQEQQISFQVPMTSFTHAGPFPPARRFKVGGPIRKRDVSIVVTEIASKNKRQKIEGAAELEACQSDENGPDEFEQFQTLCNDGKYHKLPLDRNFFADRDPSDYLGLAVRAHDAEAIDFCKDLVVLESSSSYLQSAIIDAIIKEETDVIKALGLAFPSIFTSIYAFHPPYDQLSGTSLIRIAVDQNKPKVAKAMLKFIPVAMIGDFWMAIDSMKKFIIASLHTGDINLIPKLEGDPGINLRTLTEIYYNCVLECDLEAMDYLLTNTAVPIDTIFTGDNGMTLSAMFMAAHVGHLGIVSYLYRKCPGLARVPNSMGMLPIHMAAGNGHMDVIKVLSDQSDTLTAEVTISGIKYTPFSLAIRNKKRNVADLIISFIKDQDNGRIQKEMNGLAYWAILDDNVSLLDIYFDFNTFPSSGCIDKEYNLLEMAILGIIDPKSGTSTKKSSSKKCVDRLIDEWIKHNLPFRIHHEDVITGSILGLVYPNDLDVFDALISRAKIDPNVPIYITTETGILRTTFLNRIIALGSNSLVPYAISRGCDPRILDSDGYDALAVATNHENTFVMEFLSKVK